MSLKVKENKLKWLESKRHEKWEERKNLIKNGKKVWWIFMEQNTLKFTIRKNQNENGELVTWKKSKYARARLIFDQLQNSNNHLVTSEIGKKFHFDEIKSNNLFCPYSVYISTDFCLYFFLYKSNTMRTVWKRLSAFLKESVMWKIEFQNGWKKKKEKNR